MPCTVRCSHQMRWSKRVSRTFWYAWKSRVNSLTSCFFKTAHFTARAKAKTRASFSSAWRLQNPCRAYPWAIEQRRCNPFWSKQFRCHFRRSRFAFGSESYTDHRLPWSNRMWSQLCWGQGCDSHRRHGRARWLPSKSWWLGRYCRPPSGRPELRPRTWRRINLLGFKVSNKHVEIFFFRDANWGEKRQRNHCYRTKKTIGCDVWCVQRAERGRRPKEEKPNGSPYVGLLWPLSESGWTSRTPVSILLDMQTVGTAAFRAECAFVWYGPRKKTAAG